jgi:hypothetical protein
MNNEVELVEEMGDIAQDEIGPQHSPLFDAITLFNQQVKDADEKAKDLESRKEHRRSRVNHQPRTAVYSGASLCMRCKATTCSTQSSFRKMVIIIRLAIIFFFHFSSYHSRHLFVVDCLLLLFFLFV